MTTDGSWLFLNKPILTMDNMLSKSLREFLSGPFNQLLVNLSGQDGGEWEAEFKKFLRKEPCWPNNQVAHLLEFVATVDISATNGTFIAKEKFVRDTSRKAKVKISYLGGNFTEWFLAGNGKIEDPIEEQTLRYAKLRQASVDAPIIAELGGEAKAETTLTEIFSLMEMQGNSESGALLNNGRANIFYVRDQNGVLRAVGVGSYVGGWGVGAGPVEDPTVGWGDGGQVFSRAA